MERERQVQRQVPATGGGAGPGTENMEELLAASLGILAAADRILDGIQPVNAEDYLQRNRQSGGQ